MATKYFRDGRPMPEVLKRKGPPPLPTPTSRSKVPTTVNIADGTYNALQSGYDLKIELMQDVWSEPIRLNVGIRGFNCKCKAIIKDQQILVDFSD